MFFCMRKSFFSLQSKKQNTFFLFQRGVTIDARLSGEECLKKGMEFIQDPKQKRIDLGRQYLEAGAERGSLVRQLISVLEQES